MPIKSWDFADPRDIAFDGEKIDCSQGYAALKCLVPDLLFYARYDRSVNGDYGAGSIVGRPRSGASIAPRGGRFDGGCLDLTGDIEGKTVSYYAKANADNRQRGCIAFWMKPNYSGKPETFKHMFSISADMDVHNHRNYISMHHGSFKGSIGAIVRDEKGAEPVELDGGVWEPNAGTWYHIELDWDIDKGETRLFLDGKQRGETVAAKAVRTSAITILNVGKELPDTFAPDFSIQDFHIYAVPQHTADFDPPSAPTRVHPTDNPAIVTKPFRVYQFHGFLEHRLPDGGEARYLLRIDGKDRFYDGANWMESNGTFDQASTGAQMTSGLVNYLVDGSAELVIILHSKNGAGSPRLQSVTVEYR
jgi:hypothetical protein